MITNMHHHCRRQVTSWRIKLPFLIQTTILMRKITDVSPDYTYIYFIYIYIIYIIDSFHIEISKYLFISNQKKHVKTPDMEDMSISPKIHIHV